MRYIVLSFDDGREDFYTRALPILREYGLSATLNVVTDFAGRDDLPDFASGNHRCMTWAEVEECRAAGVEIASHSADHTNELSAIERSLAVLGVVGFASPSSDIYAGNWDTYRPLLDQRKVAYIRSGNQIKRDGLGYALLYLLYRFTGSHRCFCRYNRRNRIPMDSPCQLLPSVTCNAETSLGQILSFVQELPEEHAAILMFHSVLRPGDPGWGKDKWYNSLADFRSLCEALSQDPGIQVITTLELAQRLPG